MRIHISHATAYTYSQPVRSVTQVFRMMPRDHDGQEVLNWRLETSVDGRLRMGEDEFGNITHHFTTDGPIRELTIQVEGLVETTDMAGVVQGTAGHVPDGVFLRDTDLTRPDLAIQRFANEIGAGGGTDLEKMHHLLNRINTDMVFDTAPTAVTTTAIEAFALGRGVCQDLTHIFLAASRHLNIPARYVSGYFHRSDGITAQEAGHAWAEAKVAGLGWVAFDPANGISGTPSHVRVAVGLDYADVAPIRGARQGGGMEKMDVTMQVVGMQQ
jgi:transglutaminase-like putative cysteine protease